MRTVTKFIQIAAIAAVVATVAPIASAHEGNDKDNSGGHFGVRALSNFGSFFRVHGDRKDRDDKVDKMQKRVYTGSVTAVSSNGFTFTATDGTIYTVTTAGATLKKPFGGSATIALSDIVVGDKVMVKGTANGNTISASMVEDMPANTHPAVIPKGMVTAVSGNTATVEVNHRGIVSDVTVTTDANTSVTKSDGTAGTTADVQVGSQLSIKGLWREIAKTFQAIKIKLF